MIYNENVNVVSKSNHQFLNVTYTENDS